MIEAQYQSGSMWDIDIDWVIGRAWVAVVGVGQLLRRAQARDWSDEADGGGELRTDTRDL